MLPSKIKLVVNGVELVLECITWFGSEKPTTKFGTDLMERNTKHFDFETAYNDQKDEVADVLRAAFGGYGVKGTWDPVIEAAHNLERS